TALHSASRIFMHSGEPRLMSIFARNDRPRSFMSTGGPQAHVALGMTCHSKRAAKVPYFFAPCEEVIFLLQCSFFRLLDAQLFDFLRIKKSKIARPGSVLR